MIRYLADASLKHRIVQGCIRREPAMDFISAHHARLQGVPDPEVLALASRMGRILVCSDLTTMPGHFGEFLAGGGRCPGVFLVKQTERLADVIESLVMIWAASDPREWENRIVYVPL